MIKKILVPVDYSEASLNALESAIYIAEKHNATLLILHIHDIVLEAGEPTSTGNVTELHNAMTGNLMIKHGLKTNVTFAEGMVGHVIVKTVFEKNVDLVIMGSHGESGHRNYFIGSNAYYVIKRADCPVLLIPPGKKWKEFEKIVFPARPGVILTRHHHFIYELMKFNSQRSTLHVLDVTTNKTTNTELWQSAIKEEVKNNDLADKIAISFSQNISPDIAKSVLSTTKQMKADLLVISPGVDIATKPFFVGPFSQKIINYSRIPVLSILRS